MSQKDNLSKIGTDYAIAMVMPTNDSWLTVPSIVKLAIFQKTPDKVVKTRTVGNKEIPYIKIGYVERVLNFVTNFQRGIKIVDKGFEEIMTQKKEYKDGKPTGKMIDTVIYDTWVQCDCYAILDGNEIKRSVFGSWQMYENPAVSKFACYESARSQATKSFADTLGIGSDKAWSDEINIKRDEKQKTNDEIDLSGFNK